MKDDLRWNKIFGALLGTLLAIFVLRQFAESFFAPMTPAKPGYAIAVQTEGSGEAAAAVDNPPDWGTALPAADVAAGQTVSQKCLSCHNFANGGPNLTGPNNWGVVGRAPASHAGFAYSSALQDYAKTHPAWTYDELYKFLAAPQTYVSGTKMSFVGLKQPQDRVNFIAWLRTQSSSPMAIPAPNPKAAAPAAADAAKAPDAAAAAKPADAAAGEAKDGAAAAPASK